MEISRERFLDDSRRYHLTLSVRSRTTEMHSLLSGLSPDQRDAVGAALARALDDIQTVLGRPVATALRIDLRG
jgi:hypothetical protein